MVKVNYGFTSTLLGRKVPIVKLPGKPVQRAISTGIFPTNKEIEYPQTIELIKRKKFNKKKLKLVIPTMVSEHWVTLEASWRCQLDRFTDPKTSETQEIWAIESLTVNSYPIECCTGYDLSATVHQSGPIKAVTSGIVTFPKAKFQINFESIGPTGAKTKTKQMFEFGFLQGKFKNV
ncbi:MAG: hypothetical protein WA782_13525 [Sulfitobacter sp.]